MRQTAENRRELASKKTFRPLLNIFWILEIKHDRQLFAIFLNFQKIQYHNFKNQLTSRNYREFSAIPTKFYENLGEKQQRQILVKF